MAVNEPMGITPSLYFGTRRCTYSDVVSVVTTARPIPRLSIYCQHQHTSSDAHHSSSGAAMPSANGSTSKQLVVAWGETPAKDVAHARHPEFPFALGGSSAFLDSPLAGDRDYTRRLNEWRALALTSEKQLFMTRLQQKRRDRFELEQHAALVIQRVRRGYVLRKRFREIKSKLQVRKRIRVNLVRVTRGTAIVSGEKDRRARALAAQNAAAATIQRRFRGWCARRFAAKERSLRFQELLAKSATRIQQAWRCSVARVCARKGRARLAEQRQRALAVLLTRLFRGYQARQRVRRICVRQRWLAAQRLQWTLQRFHAEKARRLQHRRRRDEQRHCAAIQVQKVARGRLSRAHVMQLRINEERSIRTACALAIQRVFRGFLGRHAVRFQRVFQAHERAWRCGLHATRLVRGFLARRAAAIERVLQETDLLIQARRGNVSTVIDLLDGFGSVDDQPADITVVSPATRNNILHLAAKHGHLGIVTHVVPKILPSSTPGVIYAVNARGESPLELAIAHGHEQVASYLLATTSALFEESAAHTSVRGDKRSTRERSLLLLAARSGMATIVAKLALLFPHIFTGSESDSWTQRTALHEALLLTSSRFESARMASEREERVVATMTTVLTKLPHVKIDAQDFVGFTALHLAAQLGNIHAVRLLLEYGADVTVADAQRRTAWRIALLHGHEPCFLEIRRKWLDSVTSSSSSGSAALFAQDSSQELEDGNGSSSALVNSATRSGGAASKQQLHPQLEQKLVDACRADEIARVRFLVEEFGVSINATDRAGDGDSLLMIASRAGNVAMVKYLVQREGAGEPLAVHYANSAGESALESALNTPTVLKLLLAECALANPCHPVGTKKRSVCHEAIRRGFHVRTWLNRRVVVTPSMLVTATDDEGRSPLHDAAAFAHVHPAKTLINVGASAGLQSLKELRTPLHEACRAGVAVLVSRMLQQKRRDSSGAALDKLDSEGRSPFFDAVISGSVECLELLLRFQVGRTHGRGAEDIAQTRQEILRIHVDADGCGLLHEAIVSMGSHMDTGSADEGGSAMLEFLIASLPECLQQQHPPRLLSPLHAACITGNTFAVEKLLRASGSSAGREVGANKKSMEEHSLAGLRDAEGLLPIHHAAKQGHLAVIDTFETLGFDCSETDAHTGNQLLHFAARGACSEDESDGAWSYHVARRNGVSPSALALLKALAQRGNAVEAFNGSGLQPLHLVTMSPSSRQQQALEVARVLVQHNAPVNSASKSPAAVTPIQLARQHGKPPSSCVLVGTSCLWLSSHALIFSRSRERRHRQVSRDDLRPVRSLSTEWSAQAFGDLRTGQTAAASVDGSRVRWGRDAVQGSPIRPTGKQQTTPTNCHFLFVQ